MQLTTRPDRLEQGARPELPTIPYQSPITQGYILGFYFH
jgi:hypothetical protein